MLPFIVIISSVRFFSPVCTPPIGVLSFFSHFFGSETTEEEGKKKDENSSCHRDCEYTHDRLCMCGVALRIELWFKICKCCQ